MRLRPHRALRPPQIAVVVASTPAPERQPCGRRRSVRLSAMTVIRGLLLGFAPLAENGLVNTGLGRAIFLVGPSSAGKSSLGMALVELLPDPFMFFDTDRCGLRGPPGRRELETLEREEVVTRGAAFALRGYLEAGLDLVVEVGLWGPRARRMAAAVFEPFDAWLVGLRWDLAELERRERRRDDGIFPGTARAQATPREAWMSRTTSKSMPLRIGRRPPHKRLSTGSRHARRHVRSGESLARRCGRASLPFGTRSSST